MSVKGILIGVGLLLVAGVGWFGAHRYERSQCEQRLTARQAIFTAEVDSAKAAGERWADTLARRQSEAITRAFAAGLLPLLLADRREGVELAAVSLLRVPGLAGVHLFAPDGVVIYSSDAKLVTLGSAGAERAWGLGVGELTTRPGGRQGTIEVALPVIDAGRLLAVVQVELALDATLAAGRPEGWPGSVSATPPVAASAPAGSVG